MLGHHVKNCNGLQNKILDKVSKMVYNESIAHARRGRHIQNKRTLKTE